MTRRTRRLAAIAAAILVLAGACAALAGPEGHGIETMTGADWKGMWGFEKRGFAECWLAGKRHQAGRTLAALQGGAGAAAAGLAAHEAELKTILAVRVTPKQLEDGVNRFYQAPGAARVPLGDALHAVVLELCKRGAAR